MYAKANSGHCALFNNFVGTRKQCWRYREAKCFGGLEVDDELKPLFDYFVRTGK
jgi:hypothetical protein